MLLKWSGMNVLTSENNHALNCCPLFTNNFTFFSFTNIEEFQKITKMPKEGVAVS